MLPPIPIEQAINRLVREEWGRILASLINSTGDFQLAEDVLQDAVEQALINWRKDGVPDSPAAWLFTTAKRKAIDKFRRDDRFASIKPDLRYIAELHANDSVEDTLQNIPDKRLELIFTCCHPALDEKSQVALTLHTLGGLRTDEIAAAFLDKHQTMAQRLTRAKKKISVAGIPFEVPERDQLNTRISPILSVIYLIFNEGYTASAGESLMRANLSQEAIRLARICSSLLPEHTEVAGLLALMLLHDSRRSARQSHNGDLVPLEQQDRSNWDEQKQSEGISLLQNTLVKQRAGPYQLQAAISAVHATSPSWQETDWDQIVALYNLLFAMQPSPVVKINQSVAVSYADSVEAALQMLDELETQASVQTYQPYFAARADLLIRLDRRDEAHIALERAIELTENISQKHFLNAKRQAL